MGFLDRPAALWLAWLLHCTTWWNFLRTSNSAVCFFHIINDPTFWAARFLTRPAPDAEIG